MTPEQRSLLIRAQESVDAVELLHQAGYHGFAASRAYFAMFYAAEAFLLGKGLAFSKHSGVNAAFGQHFVKTGIVPPEFHRYLIRGMDLRHAGDYDTETVVTAQTASEQIVHARRFLQLAESLIRP